MLTNSLLAKQHPRFIFFHCRSVAPVYEGRSSNNPPTARYTWTSRTVAFCAEAFLLISSTSISWWGHGPARALLKLRRVGPPLLAIAPPPYARVCTHSPAYRAKRAVPHSPRPGPAAAAAGAAGTACAVGAAAAALRYQPSGPNRWWS